jgi:peptidoglycan/LPS O-acetylase OafA/YrhL
VGETPDRLPGLQALRLGAAAIVFALHALYFSPDLVPSAWAVADTYFRLGVQLFYVVSAFALMHSTRVYAAAPDWVMRFYLKRFWRIAPLFYLMAAITPFYAYYANHVTTSPMEVALNLLFLNNLVPQWAFSLVYAGWSVSVEVLFYCIFPLAFATIRTLRAGALLLIASIIIGEASRAYFGQIRLPVFTYGDFNVLVHLPYFAFGILAFLAYDRLRQSRWGSAAAPAHIVLIAHATFGGAAFGLAAVIVAFNAELRQLLRIDMILWGLFFAILTTWFSVRPIAALNWRPIQFLGERSYSLYLLHVLIVLVARPLTNFVFHSFEPTIGSWAIAPSLVATYIPIVALSSLTYALVEKPGMNFGKRLHAVLARKAPPAAPTAP